MTVIRRRLRRGRYISAELAEHVLEVQFGLGGDLPASPFTVEFGDESAGGCHASSIEASASGFVLAIRPLSIPWLP
jgi:hypothetical protein